MWIIFLVIIIVIPLIVYFAGKEPAKTKKAKIQFQNRDIIKVILNLNQNKLDELLGLYTKEFGVEAGRYARKTYNKWKSGEVRPNKQTFNRFLLHLPTVMSFDLKCEVLRKLREEYCSKDKYSLKVDTRNWKETLAPLITNIINKAYTAQFPKHIERRLKWLSDDDVKIASAILAESQAQETRNAMSLLEQEIENIEHLLRKAPGTNEVIHTIELPFGVIRLNIEER